MNQVMSILKQSMKSVEEKRQKQNQKHQKNLQQISNKMMNNQTDNTQLFSANNDPFNNPVVDATREMLEKTKIINLIDTHMKSINKYKMTKEQLLELLELYKKIDKR